MADASSARIAYLKEVTWGTTPASPLKTLRMTGESLNPTAETAASNEITASRETSGVSRMSVGASGDINVEWSYGTMDDILEGVLMSAWNTNVLKVGSTPTSFTIEKQFSDVSEFMTFKGCRVNTMALQIAVGSMITGSFGVVGKPPVLTSATAGTGTQVAATTTEVMNVVDNIQAITEGGSPLAGVTALSLALNNNLRSQPQVGSLDPYGIGVGEIEITGSMTAYFATRALFQKFVDFTTSALSFKIGGVADSNYTFDLGKVKYTNASVVAGGKNTDVMAEMQFRAFKHPTDTSLKITRVTP